MSQEVISPHIFFNSFSQTYDDCASRDNWNAHEHVFNSVEKHYLSSAVQNATDTVRLLDVGIGTGLTSKHFKNAVNGIHITGVDVSQPMLNICKNKEIGDVLLRYDLNKGLPNFHSNRFDITVSSGVLEYLDDFKSVIHQMTRVTKPNGTICFTTELGDTGANRAQSEDGKIHVQISDEYVLPLTNIDRESILDTLEDENLKLLEETRFVAYSNTVNGDTECRLFTAQKMEPS